MRQVERQAPGLFSLRGRRKRLPYFLAMAVSTVIFVAAVNTGEPFMAAVEYTSDDATLIAGFACFVVMMTALWVQVCVSAQRCRDAGISAWWAVCALPPIISLVLFVALLFAHTEEAQPQPAE